MPSRPYSAPFSHESRSLTAGETQSVHGKLRNDVAHHLRKGTPVNLMPVATTLPAKKSPWVHSRLLVIVLCVVVTLAGCSTGSSDSGDESRQFATDRQPTAEPSDTPDSSAPVSDDAQPTVEPTVTAEDYLIARGAPQFAYVIVNNSLQVYDTVSRSFTLVNLPNGFIPVDHAGSPTGDRVGVLGLVDGNVVVQFFGADGEPLGEAIRLPVAGNSSVLRPAASPVGTPEATPEPAESPIMLGVTWIPQGNAVVVSGPGFLRRVSMSGEVMPISRAGVSGSVVKAHWSPMDSQLAIHTQLIDGSQGVFVLDSGNADAVELDALNLQPDQEISNLQWLPNGLGLVYVSGTSSNGELMNGQLYVYRFESNGPTLLATSAQGGPAGTITHAVVSPDGHSVAYAVMVRDQSNWHLHSLWVKPISGGSSLAIPTISNAPITNLFWTAEGLAWQQGEEITVIDGGMMPRPLGEEPAATPIASPVSTPVQEATPRG